MHLHCAMMHHDPVGLGRKKDLMIYENTLCPNTAQRLD